MKGKKNVLILIPTFADQGGAQKMVYELGKLLSEKYNVFECSFDSYNEPHIFQNTNKVVSLELPQVSGLIKKFSFYYKAIGKLKRLKKENNIDITISNLWAADFVNALSAQKDKIVTIGHINIEGNKQNILIYRLRYFVGLIYRKFDKIVAVSQPLCNELTRIFKLSENKALYINNFIDFPNGIPKIERSKSKKRVITIGRLNEVKNQESILKIFYEIRKELDTVQLVIVGEGTLKNHLMQLAEQFGFSVGNEINEIKDVIFTGFKPDPYSLLFASDIFIFPSKSEGLPLVLVEAMFAGLPIVTSDCLTGPHMIMRGSGKFVANRSDVEETPFGYLMPIPDFNNDISIEIWKSTILNLLTNEQKIFSISENVRNRALEFGKDRIKERWFELLDTL